MAIVYWPDKVTLRTILSEVTVCGYPDAVSVKDHSTDIRHALAQEVKSYQRKCLIAVLVWLPILVLSWIVPYTNPEFLNKFDVFNGNTLYVLMMFVLSSVI